MTKPLKAAVAALVILSTGSAFAQGISANDIANAANSTRGQVDQKSAKRQAELLTLMQESGKLEGQIETMEKSLSRQRTVRNVTIVVSVGLAVASGLVIRKGNQGGLGELAAGIFYGVPLAGGAVLAAVGAGGQQVAISIDSDKLSNLKTQLKETKQKLATEYAGLN